MIDIDKTCRTCMKKDVWLVGMFSPLNIENNRSLILADVLMEAAPLQVTKEDGLPQNICDECVKILQIIYIFKNQVLNSDIELKKLISTRIKNEADDEFKSEYDDMGSYDDLSISNVLSQETETKLTTYSCEICNKNYTNYDKYIKHKSCHKTSKEESSKICPICNKTFDRKSLLKEHMNDHCEPKEFNSESFETSIPEKYEIEVKMEDEEHKCSECSISFQSQKYLLLHLKEHIKSNMMKQTIIDSETNNEAIEKFDTDIKVEQLHNKLKCSQCDLVFDKYRSLISHSKKHNNSKKDQIFICNHCERRFTSKGPLKRHLLLHTVDRPYKCSECPKCYVRQDALNAHMRKHNNIKKYICEHCNKAFVQLCTLKDHVRTHTGETPYLCSECGKGFKNSSNLRQHLIRHTGVKQFACNLCPKTFCTKGQMTCHKASHLNVQPYKCDECEASFTKANSLKKHKLIHLGLKQFPCDSCSMRFMTRDQLTRHVRTHTGEKPYRCPHCTRAFSQSNDLAKHVRAHVGQNIYQCTVCQARFRLMKELRLHYPVHYTSSEVATLSQKDNQLVILKGCPDENMDNINSTSTDGQITITFNRNLLEKDGTGDITINIAPE